MIVTALNRKLFRDLRNISGQALAIALVVAAGVTLYVTYLSNFESLRRTQQAYYERQHFADVFASLKRAPLGVAAQIRDISGVTAVETRVVADVTLDLPELDQPATGRLVSIPADRRPAVNDRGYSESCPDRFRRRLWTSEHAFDRTEQGKLRAL